MPGLGRGCDFEGGMVPKGMSKFWILLSVLTSSALSQPVSHYVYFELERERITEQSFLNTPQFKGAQLKYTWSELEPEKDRYHFDEIRKNLSVLSKHKKGLVIQIQDLTFALQWKYVPSYILTDPEYHGGVALHYLGEGDAAVPEGWIARRWDKAVRLRFQKLLAELGKAFDGQIDGINLPETAFAYGDREDLKPKDFTSERYRDSIIDTMSALKAAFPRSFVLQYINFMPGEWLPFEDKGYMKSVYDAAEKWKVGVGGPDLLPYKKGQMAHAYHFIPLVKNKVPVGVAIQEGNYEHINPKTGKRVTLQELYDFGTDFLGADYLFWCTEEPFYSRDVIPFVKAL